MNWPWLVLAGVGAGLCGSVAGLASLVSYPALLLAGLSPLAANVSNTVAMLATTAGSWWGSRPELRGNGRRAARLAGLSALGGAGGAVLLLATPAEVFGLVVPWLVALGGVLLLARDRIRTWTRSHAAGDRPPTPWRRVLWPVLLVLVGVYGGYFGAGVGVILLAVLSLRRDEPLAVTNAVKNTGSGAANAVAAAIYAVIAPVHWGAAVALGTGALIGGLLGPAVVRWLPERPLRAAVGLAGLGLALKLAMG
ncbi:MAG TPA: sulfite exporter TauE/SafE family protein [Flexivirga sp.]|uniref:sulfite exporter TauE/SafE family protein n=1 Tax=Flexivirga sp. TaxID=1962927 RepID=UPI002C6B4459|nr:sulfite exporter TauE/SafE family protein [Flexivirga sp.]HWC22490.1 sulfite exporter TauE/SafE family protein [Flexivirga sp.]